MKVLRSTHKDGGFTFIDLLIVLVTVVLMAGWGYYWVNRPRARGCSGCRVNCVSNLKQVGLAARMWSNDHGERFPWQVSTNDGGTLEYASTTEVFLHFMALSNELITPKVLACSSDPLRAKATDWDNLTNANVSYFVGLDAADGKPQLLLSGDRNITTNGATTSGFLTVATDSLVRWTSGIHSNLGNIGLADGSAQQVNDAGLQAQLKESSISPVRLVIP